MLTMDLVQLTLFLVVLVLAAVPLSSYMARVFSGRRTALDPLLRPAERLLLRVAGVDGAQEMSWRQYAVALLVFNLLGMVLLYVLQRVQGYLPLNPEDLGAVPRLTALNTAVSFVTNTNWQSYAGETTMSYLTQMIGLTVQNFLSAATGIAVAVALSRGLSRRESATIGNFWVDLVRSVLWVLLPLSAAATLVFVAQGIIQNLSPYLHVATLEGGRQTLAMGPVASQEAIKVLGTNGGGFFNANSAHPFENPTPLTNLVQMLGMLAIPAALPLTFGRMTGDRRQGVAILTAMMLLFVLFLGVCYASERAGNPLIAAAGAAGAPDAVGPTVGEGKEVRFGVANSALYATATTAASCGAVNSMHDSLTPLGGLGPMLQIMLGEVVLGGVGSGLYGMLVFVILTVFIVGLMVGRTPEYLGKKIESWEMKMSVLAVLIPSAAILMFGAAAAATGLGRSAVLNPGPHGLSEILYAYSSAAGNNGSAFAGIAAGMPFYNLTLAAAMFIGRYGVIVPVLAIAGSMARKRFTPPGPGTFSTYGLLFAGLLASVVLIVGALTFFPALALGPVVEHLLMTAGRAF